MGFSAIAVFLVTTSVFVQSHKNDQTTPTPTTEPPPTTTTAAPALPGLSTWIYIGTGIGVAVLLIVCQTLFFFLYIRKLKSSQTRRSINKMAPLNSQKEHSDRYQRVPSRVNPHIAKPAEDQHSSSLYEYECVKDITGKDGIKPEPPPTSTLPKRNRPPLPLPNIVHGPKSSTLTAHSTQQLIQQRGRQVSTVPSKPPVNFNLHVPLPPRSPQTRRLPTPVRTPVLKPRDMTQNDRSHKIYESLPDLRPGRHPQMLPVARPPLILTPPTPSINPDLNKTRRLHGNGTPSPILQPKPRFPLPQEFNRNDNRKPAIALPPPVTLTPAKPSAVSNLNRCRRIPVNSQSPNTSSPNLPRRTPFPLPPRTAPKPKYTAESSDDEDWTIEEIKPMNMYNV